MKTSNGQYCIETGPGGSRISEIRDRDCPYGPATYVKVQLLPIVPQRIEWVREDNLHKKDA